MLHPFLLSMTAGVPACAQRSAARSFSNSAPAVTGVPVPTQGVGATQGVAHVHAMDVRVPGFARAQGTHLFFERKTVKLNFLLLGPWLKLFFTVTILVIFWDHL